MNNSFESESLLDDAVNELEEPYGEEEFEEPMGFDDEFEDLEDPFIGDVLNAVPKPVRGALKGLARKGAVCAGNAIGGQRGGRIAGGVADAVLRNLNWESAEFELEDDPLGEFEAMGGDIQTLQEMAKVASKAAQAPSKQQADRFIGALAGMAGKLLPGVLNALGEEEYEFEDYEEEGDEFLPALLPVASMAAPLISKGIGALGKLFSRQRRTREAFMEALPVIAAKSAATVAKQAQAGKPVTPKQVAAAVAKETASTLATKPAVQNAVRATQEMGYYSRSNARRGYGRRYQPGMRGGRRIIRPRYCVY